MLSVIVPVRNTRPLVTQCLIGLIYAFADLGPPAAVEFILIDDHSDPDQGIRGLFADFRRNTKSHVVIAAPRERGYYTFSVSLGMTLARGNQMLLVSHDMIPTKAYVQTLLSVAALDDRIGVVRGCSPHVDNFPEHVYGPPFPTRSVQDADNFSTYASRYHGLAAVEDQFLIGDSFLVRRSLIERIGVMDTSFRHLLGDIDFGVRARRAGFKLVCAKGAWLHHEGGGHSKFQFMSGRESKDQIHSGAMSLLGDAYARFRQKWGAGNLTAEFTGAHNIEYDRLMALPPGEYDAAPPKLTVTPEVVELT
jgi:GT2 family glycosyltransferase